MATNGDSNNGFLRLGKTESDSTNYRLRSDLHKEEKITCFSCGALFSATSNLDIFEHYSEKLHAQYFGDCLYCRGKVHKYQIQDQDKFFHNCSRWRRGEEK